MADPLNRTLTAVPGLSVGHAQDDVAKTGCTVVLGPFRGAVEILGLATGSRELDTLSPSHLVPLCDAVLLTGGSAFGLAAADGVVRWLESEGRGHPTAEARVPIVPAAVIYDLDVGSARTRPDSEMGWTATARASREPVAEGRVGAGTGATVGKLLGPDSATPTGVGSWAERADGVTVGALAVVNAFGDVLARDGRLLAGPRNAEGGLLETARELRERPGRLPAAALLPGRNTTLGIVATDLALTKSQLAVVARQAALGLARRISPSGTPFDGDIVFALSTGPEPERGKASAGEAGAQLELLSVAPRASAALERAIERSVTVTAGAEATKGGPGQR